jgi:hypothetical protein
MAITMTFQANVRKTAPEVYGSGAFPVDQNNRGDLCFAQALPERAELVRLGNSYGAQIKEGNAFTALITIPTTLAELALQNGESAGGKSYVIDRVWVKDVTTTAAANYVTILGQVVVPGTALVADSANKTIQSLSGKPNYGGKAQLAVHSSSVGALQDKWFTLGAAGISQPTSTSIAAAYEALCYGRYVIPPGGTFALNAQEAVSGGTCILGVEWHEVQLDLG